MTADAGFEGAPKPWVLAALAIACAATGFALARASLDTDRAALAAESTPSVVPDAPPTVAAAADADEAAPTPDAEPAPQPAPSENAAEPAAATARPSTITLGRIAYIRCEGTSETTTGACPRDASIERRVTEALESLPSCPTLSGKTGEGDVRVVFASGRMSGLGFRDVGPEGVDREAVRACLEPRLGQLRTNLPVTRMTVAFQFELRN